MAKLRQRLYRLFHPPLLLALPLAVLCACVLGYIFSRRLEHTLAACLFYPVCFYALLVLLLRIPAAVLRGRAAVHRNPYAERYLTQAELRLRFSLLLGLVLNLCYAAFKFCTGLYYRSLWFAALAVYYTMLSMIRFTLLRSERRIAHLESAAQRALRGWTTHRLCGWLMLFLNIAITAAVVQLLWQGQATVYPGLILYAAALYCFYRLAVCTISLFRLHGGGDPVLAAAKYLDLSAALMSLFSLQTAMFAVFGGSEEFRLSMVSATAVVVFPSVIYLSVRMLLRSSRQLRRLQKEKAAR